MKTFKTLLIMAVLGAVAGAGFIYSGAYPMAADEPHWPLTVKLIETLRERSIAARTKGIEVPKLDDPQLIAEGAEHYVPMCSGCHLGPGTEDTEIRMGLYPQPPKLAEHAHGESHSNMDMSAMAARQFWIIKHGLKMTGMPAWGASHDDKAIWGLVAFLQQLPEMSPGEFASLSEAASAGGHGHAGGHEHGAADSGDGHAGYSQSEKPTTEPAPAEHVDAPGAPPHSHGNSKKADSAEEGHDHAH